VPLRWTDGGAEAKKSTSTEPERCAVRARSSEKHKNSDQLAVKPPDRYF